MQDTEMFIRYLLEFSMLIPGTIGFLLPIWKDSRIDRRMLIGIAAVLNIVMILLGAFLSSSLDLSSSSVMLPMLLLPCAVGLMTIDLLRTQILFAFFNSLMLCLWSVVFANYAFAPLEKTQPDAPFQVVSGASCLLISAIVLIIFGRMLLFKFPAMFHRNELDSVWNYVWLYPVAVSIFLFWVIPIDISKIMIGRIYQVSLVIWVIFLFILYIFYMFVCYLSEKLTAEQHLIEEKRVLDAEKIRFNQLEEHVKELRSLRHDLRQHMRVLSSMASTGDMEVIKHYLQKYVETIKPEHPVYCANYAVDAIAAYYQEDAEKKGVRIVWNLSLPPRLPVDETELCVIIGNLLENAIRASEQLELSRRFIEASVRMAGDKMIGIEIRNHYKEKIRLNQEGMPLRRDSRGIGLQSVSNTVKKNNGNFTIEIDDEWFCVDIIINLPEETGESVYEMESQSESVETYISSQASIHN